MFDHGHGMTDAVADPGGGSRGSGPPLLGHDVGFLTLCPKLGPPSWTPLVLLVDLRIVRWTPPGNKMGARPLAFASW